MIDTDRTNTCSKQFFFHVKAVCRLFYIMWANAITVLIFLSFIAVFRRVARIWKKGGGGGFFERVRKVKTTLTRIFIVLESESHGLSEN